MLKYFSKFARYMATVSGSPSSFIVAFAFVVVWIITGPIFDFSVT